MAVAECLHMLRYKRHMSFRLLVFTPLIASWLLQYPGGICPMPRSDALSASVRL